MNSANMLEQVGGWAARSVGLKLLVMGFLLLVLLIPAGMIESTIRERDSTRQTAVREISSKWGDSQSVGGPWIVIPYSVYFLDAKGQTRSTTHHAYFLPDELAVNGDINTQVRYRGIYEAVLYSTPLKISGRFAAPDFSVWNIPAANVHWQEAMLAFGVTDMRGIRAGIKLLWDGQEKPVNPGIPTGQLLPSGFSARIPLSPGAAHTFSLDTQLNGSGSLEFLPFGRKTTVQLHSPWASPSFSGAFLPNERAVTPKGFSAQWQVLHLNRNYPQAWTEDLKPDLGGSGFGVELLVPADQYQKTTRSLKYAILFIVLTFGALFFIELKRGQAVHVLQYLLIGLALVFFYSLLLSLAEHIGFNAAYAVSSIAIVGMITLYAKGIFHAPRIAALVAGLMAALYLYLFSILQLEDYALLIGNLGLFIALGSAMYVSRKTDWYQQRSSAAST